jgi:hypothetical protein
VDQLRFVNQLRSVDLLGGIYRLEKIRENRIEKTGLQYELVQISECWRVTFTGRGIGEEMR